MTIAMKRQFKKEKIPIMPKFYLGRPSKSDRGWIESMMSRIPANEKDRVASEYDKIYMRNGFSWKNRDDANKFLLEESKKFRKTK